MGKAATARCLCRRKEGWRKEEKTGTRAECNTRMYREGKKTDPLVSQPHVGDPVSLLLKLVWSAKAIPELWAGILQCHHRQTSLLKGFLQHAGPWQAWHSPDCVWQPCGLSMLWRPCHFTGNEQGPERVGEVQKSQSKHPGPPPCHLLTRKWPVQRKIYSSSESSQTPNFSGYTSWDIVPSITSWFWLRYVISVWRFFETC